MKRGSIIVFLLLLIGCSARLRRVENHLLLQNRNQRLSCYTGSANNSSNCCYPYKNKFMICTYASFNRFGDEDGSIIIRYIPDNK